MSKDNKDKEINLKILLIGDSSAGKTELLLKYVDGYFPSIHVGIIVEFKIKKINVNGIDLNLHIWDTAGEERFRIIPKSFLKGADGIIFLYDITNRSSFQSLKNWLNDIKEYKENSKKIIVGNNCESEDKRQVSKETLQVLCQKMNIQGMEVSAKNGTNVNECFELLVKLIIEGKTKEEIIEKYGKACSRNEIKIKTEKLKKNKESKNQKKSEIIDNNEKKVDDENLKEKFIHKNLEKYLNY